MSERDRTEAGTRQAYEIAKGYKPPFTRNVFDRDISYIEHELTEPVV